jgi:hypothetical protein
MQRSSESIGAIASALAKAQSELTNPEKSPVAYGPHSPGRATGLSAVRPSLVGSISSARRWASTKSRPCRQPQSTTMWGSFA